ncbi:MAG: hypothetical protein ACYTGG_06730 [Planctomycetota bacterium]|jgi:hypothetical protein
MRRAYDLILTTVCCLLLLPAGCNAPDGGAAAAGADTDARPPITDDVAREEQRRQSLRNVMQAKLVYVNSLLESIALEDFNRIEYNAMELAWLSRQSDWQVHDTVAYSAFSHRFQTLASEIAADAGDGDIQAVAASYREMSAACLDCHAYLRKEGLVKDIPGVVTYAEPPIIEPEP